MFSIIAASLIATCFLSAAVNVAKADTLPVRYEVVSSYFFKSGTTFNATIYVRHKEHEKLNRMFRCNFGGFVSDSRMFHGRCDWIMKGVTDMWSQHQMLMHGREPSAQSVDDAEVLVTLDSYYGKITYCRFIQIPDNNPNVQGGNLCRTVDISKLF
jgi:hypothetical protein